MTDGALSATFDVADAMDEEQTLYLNFTQAKVLVSGLEVEVDPDHNALCSLGTVSKQIKTGTFAAS